MPVVPGLETQIAQNVTDRRSIAVLTKHDHKSTQRSGFEEMTDVSQWLERVGLPQYAAAFADNDIELCLLSELTEGDLERLGVVSLGHRKRMLKSIAELNATSCIEPPPVANTAHAERRWMTVMFCDLVDATALSTRHDPEDLREILAQYHALVQRVVSPFEGYVAQLLGDGALILFGYPRAQEAGTVRAIQAAIEVVGALSITRFSRDLQLQTRIGIATGVAVVGATGAGTPAEEVGINGEVANLAARLQAAAPVMGILISEESRHQVGGFFHLSPMGALNLKGFPAPQLAWQVLGEKPLTSRFEAQRPGILPDMVGRDGELELLLERWELACQREGETVVVSAEPGMGKSRLAQALRERVVAQDAHVLSLQCSPYHQGSPLFPVSSWLERTCGIRAEDNPSERRSKLRMSPTISDAVLTEQQLQLIEGLLNFAELPADLRQLPGPELRRQTQAALVGLIACLAANRPVLVMVEDAHWIDPSTEEFIRDVAHLAGRTAILMLLTCRPEYPASWIGSASVTRLSLNKLGRRACATLAAAIAQKGLPDALLAEILSKTDGVPLFVEELTRTVLHSGELIDAGEHWQLKGPIKALSVPATLHDSLKARLDQLSDAQEFAQVCSALGREFDVRIAAKALALPDASMQSFLQQLERSGLVVASQDRQEHMFIFRHALIRDVAYGGMVKSVRSRYHARIAEVLEDFPAGPSAPRPEVLAFHHEQAGESAKAWPLWSQAGSLALDGGANAEAAEHFASALRQIGHLPALEDARLSIMLRRGEALQNSAGYAALETTACMSDARELAAKLGRLDDHMTALLSAVPATALASGRFQECIQVLEAFPKSSLDELDGPLRVAYLLYLGIAYHHVGRLEDSWHTLMESKRLNVVRSSGTAHLFGGASAIVPILSYAARNRVLAGDMAHCQGLIGELWRTTLQDEHPPSRAWALQMRAWGDLLAGEFDRAAASATELITLAERIGLRTRAGVGKIHLGRAWIQQGRFEDGIRTAREGLVLWRAAGGRFHCSEYAASIAASILSVGDLEHAIEFIEYGERIQLECDESFYVPELLRLRGCWQESHGDLSGAKVFFQSAFDAARAMGAKAFECSALIDLSRLALR